MNEWHRMARVENHRPQLPPSQDISKMEEAAQREADVFAEIQKKPMTVKQISKYTGKTTQSVRVTLLGLTACKRVVTKKGARGELLYCLPDAIAPKPIVDKYPGTVVDERRHTGAVNTTNQYQLTVRVRLPAPPWHGRKSDDLAARVAKPQEGRSTGKNVGVSEYRTEAQT